jgi:WD40 repeat protein
VDSRTALYSKLLQITNIVRMSVLFVSVSLITFLAFSPFKLGAFSFVNHMYVCNTQSIAGHTSPVHAVALNEAENVVGTGAFSGVLKIWDLETNKRRFIVYYAYKRNSLVAWPFCRQRRLIVTNWPGSALHCCRSSNIFNYRSTLVYIPPLVNPQHSLIRQNYTERIQSHGTVPVFIS